MNSNCKTKEDQLFWKQAWYSNHPTLLETGIGIGGFKKPDDVTLNVDIGDLAEITDNDLNEGAIVKVIRYAGEKPWWKGYVFIEDEGPCWIIQAVSKPLQINWFDSIIPMIKAPIPDYMLKKLEKTRRIEKE